MKIFRIAEDWERPIYPEDVPRIVEMFVNGTPIKELSSIFQSTEPKISKVITQSIGPIRFEQIKLEQIQQRGLERSLNFTEEQKLEILRRYTEDLDTMAQIAIDFKTTAVSIGKVLREYLDEDELKMYQNKRVQIPPAIVARIVDLYRNNKAIVQIQNDIFKNFDMKVYPKTIRDALVEALGEKEYLQIRDRNREIRKRKQKPVHDAMKAKKDYRRIRNELYEDVVIDYKKGLGVEDIANKYDLDIFVVHKFLEEYANSPF